MGLVGDVYNVLASALFMGFRVRHSGPAEQSLVTSFHKQCQKYLSCVNAKVGAIPRWPRWTEVRTAGLAFCGTHTFVPSTSIS